tara:strand:- start:1110 stop:2096 length:987 start_codon:yes stop_codon:yes gene_type:complete
MKILITGSSGYIGSCCYEYFKHKFNIYGLDKTKPKVIKQRKFFHCNLLNYKKLNNILKVLKPDVIIHLAGQSTIDFINKKSDYLKNNNIATKNLLKCINQNNIRHLIFSSTAAVYESSTALLKENSPIKPNNIYGQTKQKCEDYIFLNKKNQKNFNYIIFRFFNVCSSLASLRIGELHDPETHLVPILANKFKNKETISIYGDDYKTNDGTCIRDYIHILDIIIAFHKGINYLENQKKSSVINLGSSIGFSCLEIFNKFKKYFPNQENVMFFIKKRKGDISKLVCDNKKAFRLLNWKPKNSRINKIISDELKWLELLNKKKIKRKTIY